MPIFDFACNNCGKNFDLMISNTKKNTVQCPQCGSSNIKQLLSSFGTSSGSKGASSGSCQTCNAGGGGG